MKGAYIYRLGLGASKERAPEDMRVGRLMEQLWERGERRKQEHEREAALTRRTGVSLEERPQNWVEQVSTQSAGTEGDQNKCLCFVMICQ